MQFTDNLLRRQHRVAGSGAVTRLACCRLVLPLDSQSGSVLLWLGQQVGDFLLWQV